MFIPYKRAYGNLEYFLSFVGDAELVFKLVPEICRDEAKLVTCHYFLPTCGNSTVFEPPTPICEDTCIHLRSLCPNEWEQVRQFMEAQPFLTRNGFTMINCSNTGEYLPPSHCCEDLGIEKCKCNSVHPFYHDYRVGRLLCIGMALTRPLSLNKNNKLELSCSKPFLTQNLLYECFYTHGKTHKVNPLLQ